MQSHITTPVACSFGLRPSCTVVLLLPQMCCLLRWQWTTQMPKTTRRTSRPSKINWLMPPHCDSERPRRSSRSARYCMYVIYLVRSVDRTILRDVCVCMRVCTCIATTTLFSRGRNAPSAAAGTQRTRLTHNYTVGFCDMFSPIWLCGSHLTDWSVAVLHHRLEYRHRHLLSGGRGAEHFPTSWQNVLYVCFDASDSREHTFHLKHAQCNLCARSAWINVSYIQNTLIHVGISGGGCVFAGRTSWNGGYPGLVNWAALFTST